MRTALLSLFLGLLAVASCVSAGEGQAKRSKVVSTLLDAKWPSTPFVLEAMEFLSDESGPEAFWDIVDFLAEEEANLGKITDKELYDRTLSFSSRYLSWTQLNLLKLSLSLRTKSPRIEMFQQVAKDRGVPDIKCDKDSFVLETAGKLHCTLESAREALKKNKDLSVSAFKIDHHYPRRDPSSPVVILYAQPGDPGFAEMHSRLKGLASRGDIDYVLRPFLASRKVTKTRLSGFGVELQIKSSEYKAQDDRKVNADGESDVSEDGDDDGNDEIDGFDFKALHEKHPESGEKLDEFKQHLLDQRNDMAPLKVWELQDLSLQAAERVLSSPKEKQLKVLTDLAQNFPSQARSLSKVSVSKDLKKEVKKNSETFMMNMNLQPSDAALFVNGMFFDMDYVDVFTIMDALKSEARVLDGLGQLGLTDEQARQLIVQDFSSGKITYGLDVRDSAVNWINDIEKDRLYKGWPESVTELLRPAFPGMLRSIRKNLFNVVIMCDPSKRESMSLIKLLESFYVHRAPTRIGIVFAVNSDQDATGKTDAGVAFLDAFNFISSQDNKEVADALSFITDVYATVDEDHEGDVTVEQVHQVFLENYGSDAKLDDVFDEDSEYDIGRQLAKDFVDRSGFQKLPQVLMNGVPMEEKNLDGESFEEELMMAIMRSTSELQKAVYHGKLKEGEDVLNYLMSQPSIMPRLNDRVLKSSSSDEESETYFDYTGDVLPSLMEETYVPADKGTKTATLADNLSYVFGKDGGKLHILTAWVIADLESPQGREVLRGAVTHVKSSKQMRVAVINNAEKPGLISKTVKAALETLDNSATKHFLSKVLKEDTVKKLTSGKKQLGDYDIPGTDMSALTNAIDKLEEKDFLIEHSFVISVLEIPRGQNMVILNGRPIGPFKEGETFGDDDYNLLEKFSMSKFGDKMVNIYYTHLDIGAPKVSDQAMKISSLLLTRPQGRSRSTVSFYGDKHSAIKVDPAMPDRPSFDITAVVDPTSTGAQKIAPLLQVLSNVLNARIRIFLNCVEKHSEMPQKSYFRAVLQPELTFNEEGSLAPGPVARFAGLPEELILTMHYHIPDNWLIEPIKSVYDLDNIKLALVTSSGVHSEFELEHLLLEGHCFEAVTGNPPRGLQLTIGTEKDSVVGDTIVMANLGYLQLKSTPGRWYLDLREGRSAELYDILSHEGTEGTTNDGKIQVLMDSFQSKIVKLRVQKKPDKRNEELLEADSASDVDGGGLWDSLASTFSGSKSKDDGDEEEDNTLNIFCLASGHLYERLLKIMMLSTIRHTDAKVKFWVLKNFLSPSLKEFLPEYARRYDFEYEYVQYKWPRWLNQQKEKQRIIWGYKILFLDVMFPLDVKKIIFVDTDQIVRADLTELRDMNLKGAPYGYTPFCDSNKDMEGFRFWKSGYWKNHLAGRPYHISALYVVDLVRFRRIAAGDRLRGQYQALSQDPNSLSNLDQDLPNNMIHQVPIFSLPPEWLWCETWCDQASKVPAKSIDLCNNPLTKESKLDAARRIAPEWTGLDDEMHRLGEEISSGLSKQKSGPVEEKSEGSHVQHKHSEL